MFFYCCCQVIVDLVVGKDSDLEWCVVGLWGEVFVTLLVPELGSMCVSFVPFVVLGSYPYYRSVLVHVCAPGA